MYIWRATTTLALDTPLESVVEQVLLVAGGLRRRRLPLLVRSL